MSRGATREGAIGLAAALCGCGLTGGPADTGPGDAAPQTDAPTEAAVVEPLSLTAFPGNPTFVPGQLGAVTLSLPAAHAGASLEVAAPAGITAQIDAPVRLSEDEPIARANLTLDLAPTVTGTHDLIVRARSGAQTAETHVIVGVDAERPDGFVVSFGAAHALAPALAPATVRVRVTATGSYRGSVRIRASAERTARVQSEPEEGPVEPGRSLDVTLRYTPGPLGAGPTTGLHVRALGQRFVEQNTEPFEATVAAGGATYLWWNADEIVLRAPRGRESVTSVDLLREGVASPMFSAAGAAGFALSAEPVAGGARLRVQPGAAVAAGTHELTLSATDGPAVDRARVRAVVPGPLAGWTLLAEPSPGVPYALASEPRGGVLLVRGGADGRAGTLFAAAGASAQPVRGSSVAYAADGSLWESAVPAAGEPGISLWHAGALQSGTGAGGQRCSIVAMDTDGAQPPVVVGITAQGGPAAPRVVAYRGGAGSGATALPEIRAEGLEETSLGVAVRGAEVLVCAVASAGVQSWQLRAGEWRPLAPPDARVLAAERRFSESGAVACALDEAARPVLAWVDARDETLRAARFEGGAWSALGAPVGALRGAIYTHRLVARGGVLALAWNEASHVPYEGRRGEVSSARIRVRVLRAEGWAELAPVTPEDSLSALRSLQLTAEPSGAVLLAWQELGSSFVARAAP